MQTFDAVSLEELYGDYAEQLCAASLVEVAQVWTFPTPSPTMASADTSATDDTIEDADLSNKENDDDTEDPTNTALIIVGVIGMLAIMLWAGRVVHNRRGEKSEGMISYKLRPTGGDDRREVDNFSYGSSPGRNMDFDDGYNYDPRYMHSPSPSPEFDGVGIGGASYNGSPPGYPSYRQSYPHETLEPPVDPNDTNQYYDQYNDHERYSPESHQGSRFYSRSPSPTPGYRDYNGYNENYDQNEEELYYPQSPRGVNAQNNHYV